MPKAVKWAIEHNRGMFRIAVLLILTYWTLLLQGVIDSIDYVASNVNDVASSAHDLRVSIDSVETAIHGMRSAIILKD